MIPHELIQRFWAMYLKLKAGDLPDTLPEVIEIGQLILDVLKLVGGSLTAQSAMAPAEAEAVVKALAEGEPTAQAALAGPALRELLKLAWPLVQDLIRKQLGL